MTSMESTLASQLVNGVKFKMSMHVMDCDSLSMGQALRNLFWVCW